MKRSQIDTTLTATLFKTLLTTLVVTAASLAMGGVIAETNQDTNLISSQRLSEWLEKNKPSSNAYPLGLMWVTPEEKNRQEVFWHKLQEQLKTLESTKSINPEQRDALERVLLAMPPSGRVQVNSASAKWLEANPKRDPVLEYQDAVFLPQRPTAVRVMNAYGVVCEVLHKEGLLAKDYVAACLGTSKKGSSPWAWVVQPDGRIQKLGITSWNIGAMGLQSQIAPGAWLWVPDAANLTDEFNYQWASWLASQGVVSNIELNVFKTAYRQVSPPVIPVTRLDIEGRGLESTPSANNWGNVGLIQTPTARMQEAGYFGLSRHKTWPYTNTNVMLQPLDWMELGFRYTDVSNRLYSSDYSFSGDQSYKDKSFDLKLRAWRESDWIPELAVGWRDAGGTGLFSSEYVVASKREGRLDFSLGVGWGYLGKRGNLRNPLSALGKSFDERTNDVGNGGQFAATSWFHGRSALFGGIEYQTPWNVVLKAELDGNNYKNDPLGNSLEVKSPINWGLVYRGVKGLDVMAGVERGNKFSFGLTFNTNFSGLNVPKVTDPPVPAVARQRPSQEPNWLKTAQAIETQTQWTVNQIYKQDDKLVVETSRSLNPAPQVRLDKAMAVIHRDAPEQIENIEVQHKSVGDVLAVEKVNRTEWVLSQTQPARTNEPRLPKQPTYEASPDKGQPQIPDRVATYYFEPGLDFIETLGGPNGFVMYQFSAAGRFGLNLPHDFQVRGLVRHRVMSNYDKFTDPGSSDLPRVRTYLREYMVTSKDTLTNLSLVKTGRISRDVTWATYGGYFEEMFGGVGGEMMYRQPGSSWAVSVNTNYVQQRDFRQNFDFRDYKVNTGHITGYWQTPYEGVFVSVANGKYLAGDKGYTATLARVFANGSTFGVYGTKTNVPAALFGEGSFDKGIFWSIPFDAFLTSSSRSYANLMWKPLTRDGGAMVSRPVNLYAETYWLSPDVNRHLPAPPSNDSVVPDDRVEPFMKPRY